MENRILNRHCFIRKNRLLYCSKCGKQQLQDQYNMNRHTSVCKFNKYDFIEVFEEGKDYAYSFKISPNGEKLFFIVFTPMLKEWGPNTNIYTGGEWKEVFRATFCKNSRNVSEKGLYNVDFWMKLMLDEKKMKCLSKDDDYEIIQNFFSDVIGFSSYGSFLDIYRNKGYGSNKPMSDEYALTELEDLSFAYNHRWWGTSLSSVYGKLLKHKNELFLHIATFYGKDCTFNAIVGDKYVFSNTPNINDVLKGLLFFGGKIPIPPANSSSRKKSSNVSSCYYNNMIEQVDIDEFARRYPSFMIKEYLKAGGHNILIPLFASNYDKCMELLYKAGMPLMAENLEVVKRNNHLTLYMNNLKEIFGLPVNTLRRITSSSMISEANAFDLMKEIYQFDVRYLSDDKYSITAINFLQNQNITNKKDFKPTYYTCHEINRWSNDEKYKTFKYLNKIGVKYHISSWGFYKDYIETCVKLGEFVYGKWPKDLQLAHDDVMSLYTLKSDKEREEIFIRMVSDENYLALTTAIEEGNEDVSEDVKKYFKESKYTIIAPKSSYDLVNESANMNNCVKTYIDRVRDGRTKIYFLRNKKNIKKSLCTIEVSASNDIIQLKAYANAHAPDDIRAFVLDWAKFNHLGTNCYDLR